jgi:hypothetical protein
MLHNVRGVEALQQFLGACKTVRVHTALGYVPVDRRTFVRRAKKMRPESSVYTYFGTYDDSIETLFLS